MGEQSASLCMWMLDGGLTHPVVCVVDTHNRSDQACLYGPGQCVSEQLVHRLWALNTLVIIVPLDH